LKEITKAVCSCGSFDTVKTSSSRGTLVLCKECGKELRVIMPTITQEQYYKREHDKCKKLGWNLARAGIMYKNRYGSWPSKEIREACK